MDQLSADDVKEGSRRIILGLVKMYIRFFF